MKFMSYLYGRQASYGVELEDGVLIDLPAAATSRGAKASGTPATLLDFIGGGERSTQIWNGAMSAFASGSIASARRTLDDVTLLAPIVRPTKNVFCVGRNYVDHVKEGYAARGVAAALPEHPQFFTKAPTTVIGPDARFYLDTNVTQKLDYEVELAVIIGKSGINIKESDAFEHVFGYTILNDITARDLQRRHDQWFKGKSLDRSCPLGPWIVDRATLPDPQALSISLSVNGEVRQQSDTSAMIFSVATIISTLSAGLTLEPGDIIATGTPSGVGYAMNPARFLQPGDLVEASIGSIGTLRTVIAAFDGEQSLHGAR